MYFIQTKTFKLQNMIEQLNNRSANFFMFKFYISMQITKINLHSPDYKSGTPSFSAMKASAFNGVDYYCMRKLKAPIEKFNTLRDFQLWAFEQLKNKFRGVEYGGRGKNTAVERKDIINQWLQGMLTNTQKYSYAFALVALQNIIHTLKPDNDDLPVIYNDNALTKTHNEISDKISFHKDTSVSFRNIYKKHLLSLLPQIKNNKDENWVVIHSIPNDPQNYEDNITRLQLLSHRSWCTKTSTARMHLMYGDIHIMLEKGEPRIALRFFEDEINEIQSIGNRGINPKDIPVIEKYIDINGFRLSANIKHEIETLKKQTQNTD